MKNKSILYVVNVDWFFISHRLVIAEEARKNGFEVIVAAEDTGRSQEIINKGIRFINLSFSRSGTNPFKEFNTLLKFYKIYSKLKPDIVHHITLKPVIYGSIIAKLLNLKSVINAVSGLGYNFTEGRINLISKIMLQLMKYGFRNKLHVIFQNKNDFQELSELQVLSPNNRIYYIKGSGVDLQQFYTTYLPSFDKIKIVLPSRMLWDKGVKEFYEAANLLRAKYFDKIEFVLAGMADEDNRAGLPASILEQWEDGCYFKWVGHQKDIFTLYKNFHIVVLPSYREGMPKTLIEACAMGRALITTDAIGCRECVDEGINGFKVPIKDSQSLANAIQFLVENPNRIIEMGIASRAKAEKEFDVNSVIKTHLEIYNSCI
ncbi:glycosyltransferase family 4 protein [Sediminibacterium sp.]|uniref:glycosyltransferase family 4 protein n=1 Tax=Sediminibacterium sp. TaxID=1917865 RepID=UPI003F71B1C3